jgi:uncharacterized protein (TIGR03083 family)
MTKAAIEGLETEVRRAKELFAALTVDEWSAPSGCAGWRVQDVAQHMASVFQQIADPASIDTGDAEGAEQAAEVPVQARRDWTPAEVVAAYDEWSAKGAAALSVLQEPPMADTAVPLSDLGTHPLHLLANAIAFDHYCHLRHDIGASVDRAAQLPHDEAVLRPALEWMLAGLPQMCAGDLAAAPAVALNLTFDGPAASSWALVPGDGSWTVTEGLVDDAPVVRTTAHDFVAWATKRSDWRDSVRGDVGDPQVAAVLDTFNVI